jgi:arylsulfatase A-like enzyme
MKSPYQFKRHGESGAPVSEVYPHLAKHVDEMTFLYACNSKVQNHVPACYMVNSGITRVGAPCVGSWLTYGLGSENQNLPGYVVMYDHRSAPEGGANLWDAAFLPGENQGVTFRPTKHPLLYLKRPDGLSRTRQSTQLKLLQRLNAQHKNRRPEEIALQARIKSFETAYNMQTSAGQIVDTSAESQATQKLYGMDDPACKHFGTQLLMTRRLIEKGVRVVQLYHGGFKANWDQHSALEEDHRKRCYETDRPIAGLLTDLKQRGLLDSTLVIWGGEFGRSPTSQDRNGRDHNPFGFTMWAAGGGMKRGFQFGATDEFGYKPVENTVSMHDFHATVLHLMGMDHEQLTYFHNGRDQSLTNNRGDVVREIVA